MYVTCTPTRTYNSNARLRKGWTQLLALCSEVEHGGIGGSDAVASRSSRRTRGDETASEPAEEEGGDGGVGEDVGGGLTQQTEEGQEVDDREEVGGMGMIGSNGVGGAGGVGVGGEGLPVWKRELMLVEMGALLISSMEVGVWAQYLCVCLYMDVWEEGTDVRRYIWEEGGGERPSCFVDFVDGGGVLGSKPVCVYACMCVCV